jgi:hypothetical protein
VDTLHKGDDDDDDDDDDDNNNNNNTICGKIRSCDLNQMSEQRDIYLYIYTNVVAKGHIFIYIQM